MAKKQEKNKERLMQRDNCLCGIHTGGCYRKVDYSEYSADHMIPHSYIKTLPNYNALNRNHLKQPMHKKCNNENKRGSFDYPIFVCKCHMIYFCCNSKRLYIENQHNGVWHRQILMRKCISNPGEFSLVVGRRKDLYGFSKEQDFGHLIKLFTEKDIDWLRLYNLRSLLLCERFDDYSKEAYFLENSKFRTSCKNIDGIEGNPEYLAIMIVDIVSSLFSEVGKVADHIDTIARARIAVGGNLGLELYKAVLAANIENHRILNNYGWALFEEKLYQKAIPFLEAATKAAPPQKLYWSNLGIAYEYAAKESLENKDFETATAIFNKIDLIPRPFCQEEKARKAENLLAVKRMQTR